MWGTDAADSADWELSKENVQPLRQGRRVDVLNSSLQTTGDEQTAQKSAEERRNFELEIRTYSGDDPLAPWHQYVLWMEQHCPRGGHEGNLDGLLTQCIARFSAETRYHQDPRFVALIIKQARSSQQSLETFMNMFGRHIGTQLTMFYQAWSAQFELTGNMMRADSVLAEGERLGAQPADELAEARRKLQTRVASALAAGTLSAPPAQIGRSAAEERHALGALKGSSDGAVPRQRVGAVQAGRPGTLPTAAAPPQHARHNHRLNVFVDENAPQPAAPVAAAPGATELPTGRAMHKENVRKAGPWGEPQKASKRPAPAANAPPTFSVYEDSGAGAAHGSPITVKPGALAARAVPAPAAADGNIPVAHFEPPNDKVKAMYCKDVIYAGAGEVSLEELRAARWNKENRLLLKQRRMYEEVQRTMQEVLRKNEETQRRNEQLEREVQELKARPPPPPASLHGSLSSSAHLGSSNVSGGSSSLAGHSNNLSGSTVLASPTVNTRDALNYVREMLNRTVETSLQVPRHSAAVPAPAAVPFTVYEEPEASVSVPPPASAATPFTVYEEPAPPPAPAAAAAQKPSAAATAPFSVYEDDACVPPPADGSDEGDSDQENRPPADCPPPPPRRRPPNILVDAVDIPTEPLEEPAAPSAAAAGPVARRPLQFDDELTGFVPLTNDVSFAVGDLSQFAAAAGRVASTPFVPPQPPPAVGTAARARRDEEEGDFTASLKSVRISRPAGGDRTSPTDGGALTPIMERSREQYKSSSSSSGSDMSRQSRCDFSAPMSAQPWRQRPSVGVDPSHLSAAGPAHLSARAPPSQLTQSSGYLGDRSGSVRPASVATDCSMSRRPDSADVSDVQPPDVSMAPPAGSPDCSALRPADLSEKAAELSLAPTAERSRAHLSAAELSAVQPPAGLLSPAQPPAELSAFQPPADLSPAQPPADLSIFQPPADLSPAQPPADLSIFQPPADLSIFQPPADLSIFQPPAELSAVQLPAELSAVQPPAELSPVQPPAPSAALSALTLEEVEHPDPWDAKLLAGLLRGLSRPIETRERYRRLAGKLPNFKCKEVEIDGRRLAVTLIGEGAYARVYHAIDRESGAAHCLKVQPDGGEWEFYVVDELRERLLARGGQEPLFLMTADRVAVYDNGSVLCSEYEPAGTLLNLHNKLIAMHRKFDECLAMLFTAEMLGAVSAVHTAGMIHGDVKPDNFLLRGSSCELEDTGRLMAELRSSELPQLLQLIDFGRAIDMTLLPPGTTFTHVVTTDDFTCPEMKDGRQWTYQTDLYGVAASAHVLLFGSYLKLTRRPGGDGSWTISGTIRRFWSPVWAEFFAAFLNISSCSELPDLAAWRHRFLELALSRDLLGALRRLVVAIKQR